ncbi:hypothetical protein [Nocardia sp. NPDC049707]|uniref:hypothetical protein n=1 Tax=Nocardia sp. NPDC049707 TaxID=3154735 RepID=UPI00342C5DA4
MDFPVDFGIVQIGLMLIILVAVALLISALVMVRKVGLRVLIGRGAGGLALLIVAVLLLWVVTLTQTFLGLSGEIKAAHVVVNQIKGQDHRLEVDLTLYGDDHHPDKHEKYQVEGDL